MRFTLPLIALALAAPAFAAPAEEVVTVRIAYGDVDVTTTEGRATLETRIAAQLRKACAVDVASRYNYGRPSVDRQCVTEARTAALAEVDRVVAMQARSAGTVAAN